MINEKWNEAQHAILKTCFKKLSKTGYYQAILAQTVLAKDYADYFTEEEKITALNGAAHILVEMIKQQDYSRAWFGMVVKNLTDRGITVVNHDELVHGSDLDALRLEVRKLKQQLADSNGFHKMHKEACDKSTKEYEELFEKMQSELKRLWEKYPESKGN